MNPSKGGFPWLFFGLVLAGAAAVKPFWGNPDRGSVSQASSASEEDLSCNCKVRGESFTKLSFEKAETCGADRNYLQDSLARFDQLDSRDFYTKTREGTASKIPRKCFLFAMKHTFPNNFKSPSFGRCDKDLQKTKSKPCVTEPLVDLVYNTSLDVADCFGIPAKSFLPKLMHASGVIPNSLVSGEGSGLFPISNGTLQILKEEYPTWSLALRSSKKASCARLLSIKGAMPPSAGHLRADDPSVCSNVGVPPNPVRNLIYYGAYHQILQKEVAASFERLGLRGLLKRLRVDESSESALQKILMALSYESGPKSVVYLREWLRYRLVKFSNVPLVAADFNPRISPDPWKDFDQSTLTELKTRYESGGNTPMSFWQWLVVAKKKFRAASYLKFYADRLDANLGEGVCTESKFLEL